jgi:aminoglycoside phosphotransferase (APT) family kinase protein
LGHFAYYWPVTIPENKTAAVTRALNEAFGVDEFEDIQVPHGGLSTALVFRMLVRGKAYLLRLIMRADAMGDPTRQIACMKTAAEAGIAPMVRYASIEDRIIITDFIEAKPFPENPAPMLARTMRTLHGLGGFPKALQVTNYMDTVDGFIGRFRAAKILPESTTEEIFRLYAAVPKVYPRDESLVACHNDLKPQNIIFDGDRFWLVDWEAAFLNDRYSELAVVANFFVRDEDEYLEAYFGEPAGEWQKARFFLMRQAVHMFYASFFLLMAARSGAVVTPDLEAPDFDEFHARVSSGELNTAAAEVQVPYAKVHLSRALRNMRGARFRESVEAAGNRAGGLKPSAD